MLIGRGHPPLRDLIHLVELIESVRNRPGFPDVLQRLKKGCESNSVYFELRMAHAFAEKNVQVEFPKRAKKRLLIFWQNAWKGQLRLNANICMPKSGKTGNAS
jgi:hypothetical protein